MGNNNNNTDPLPAWLQLYLAKQTRPQTPAVDINPVGRPSRVVPAKRTSLWLTAGDRKVIAEWQSYLGKLTGRSMSIGETFSLLSRICNERLDLLGGQSQFSDIAGLTIALIGEQQSDK